MSVKILLDPCDHGVLELGTWNMSKAGLSLAMGLIVAGTTLLANDDLVDYGPVYTGSHRH